MQKKRLPEDYSNNNLREVFTSDIRIIQLFIKESVICPGVNEFSNGTIIHYTGICRPVIFYFLTAFNSNPYKTISNL